MRKSHSLVIATLLALAALGALAQDSPAGVVNVNTATAEQLAYLPGVGPKTAEEIIAYREANGAFKKLTDLMQVKGIGDKTFERLQPYVTIEGKTTLSSSVTVPREPSPKAQR
jgi:competence protein ComEA